MRTHPLYPLAKTVGVLNTDSMGVWGPAKNFTISGTAKLDLLDDLIAAGKQEGRYFTPDPHPESGGFYRSDHFSFAKQGVPAISFKPGNDLLNGGSRAVRHWRPTIPPSVTTSRADEFDRQAGTSAAWRRTPICSTSVGERLANSREWPNWSPDSEFRAMRDQSAAERGSAAPAPGPHRSCRPRRESAVERNARACSSRSSGRAGGAADAAAVRFAT